MQWKVSPFIYTDILISKNSFSNKFLGLHVGNNDKNGEKIIEVKPVESNTEQRLLGYEGENPTVMEVPVSFRIFFFFFFQISFIKI